MTNSTVMNRVKMREVGGGSCMDVRYRRHFRLFSICSPDFPVPPQPTALLITDDTLRFQCFDQQKHVRPAGQIERIFEARIFSASSGCPASSSPDCRPPHLKYESCKTLGTGREKNKE